MQIKHLIFDLDDTLYSSSNAISKAISTTMINCAADFFHVDFDEASRMRTENLPKYSSTLDWLRNCGFTDVEGFFAKVHPEDETKLLSPAPKLRPLLKSFDLPMTVLTNAPREHAERVLDFYGVRDLFSSITDIRDCNLQGKPFANSYEIALKRAGGTVKDSLFIDDQLKYALGFKVIGGVAVKVGKEETAEKIKKFPAFLFTEDNAGTLFKIPSIYELPALLKKINSEQ